MLPVFFLLEFILLLLLTLILVEEAGRVKMLVLTVFFDKGLKQEQIDAIGATIKADKHVEKIQIHISRGSLEGIPGRLLRRGS